MSVLIPCRQPPFSDITINFLISKTESPKSCSPEQNREIQKNWTGQEKFDIYL